MNESLMQMIRQVGDNRDRDREAEKKRREVDQVIREQQLVSLRQQRNVLLDSIKQLRSDYAVAQSKAKDATFYSFIMMTYDNLARGKACRDEAEAIDDKLNGVYKQLDECTAKIAKILDRK